MFTTKDQAGAIAFASPLSYPMVADQLPPLITNVLHRPRRSPPFERSLRQPLAVLENPRCPLSPPRFRGYRRVMSVTDLADLPTELVVSNVVLDYGDQALLLQFDSTAEVLAWTDALREAALPGVLDIVPAARTVLVKLDGPRYQGVIRHRLRKLRVAADAPRRERTAASVVIDVVYDGADLAEVADLTGLTTAQVINAHTATPWRVGFCGFAPGFAYLVDGDPRLRCRGAPSRGLGAGRFGRPGRRIQRRSTRVVPRRLAVDRPHRRGRCGTSTDPIPRC